MLKPFLLEAGERMTVHSLLTTRPLAKVELRPQPPILGGEYILASPRIGGFRGHSTIYARGLLSLRPIPLPFSGATLSPPTPNNKNLSLRSPLIKRGLG